MSISQEWLESFRSKTFILIFFDILFLTLPGVAVIYVLNQDLFASLDWIKLILLAASISTPFSFLNAILIDVFDRGETPQDQSDKEGRFFINFSLSIILTGLYIYLLLAIVYYFNRSTTEAIVVTAGLEIIGIILLWWRDAGIVILRKLVSKFRKMFI